MKIQIEDSEENISEFIENILKADDLEAEKKDSSKNNDSRKGKHHDLDILRIRQLEQKQQLLLGLTHLLFKKFEELHPTQKFSKFDLMDISWYRDKLNNAS